MLSQQDDSFKHISRLCKRHSHCRSAVYTAVNSSFKWKRTAVVILWNNSKNYQSLLNKELLAQSIWLLYFRHVPPRGDQVPLEIIGGRLLTTKKTLASCSTLYLTDHQPRAQCNSRPSKWHLSTNRAGELRWNTSLQKPTWATSKSF